MNVITFCRRLLKQGMMELSLRLFVFVFAWFVCLQFEEAQGQAIRSGCTRPKLRFGRAKVRSRGAVVYYRCRKNYLLIGTRFATCLNGKWTRPTPICADRGCPPPAITRIVSMELSNFGSMATFSCAPGYIMKGPNTAVCLGGKVWNGTAPQCIGPDGIYNMTCTFENGFRCGWTQDSTDDFDWIATNGATATVDTGPSFDHTLGPGNSGTYLYIEASMPRVPNDTARLLSPVFSERYSYSCFEFWYHLYGRVGAGELRVYVKPVTKQLRELKPRFEIAGDQRDVWRKGMVTIEILDAPFQIVIEGKRLNTYFSDIAIDDLKIFRCPPGIVPTDPGATAATNTQPVTTATNTKTVSVETKSMETKSVTVSTSFGTGSTVSVGSPTSSSLGTGTASSSSFGMGTAISPGIRTGTGTSSSLGTDVGTSPSLGTGATSSSSFGTGVDTVSSVRAEATTPLSVSGGTTSSSSIDTGAASSSLGTGATILGTGTAATTSHRGTKPAPSKSDVSTGTGISPVTVPSVRPGKATSPDLKKGAKPESTLKTRATRPTVASIRTDAKTVSMLGAGAATTLTPVTKSESASVVVTKEVQASTSSKNTGKKSGTGIVVYKAIDTNYEENAVNDSPQNITQFDIDNRVNPFRRTAAVSSGESGFTFPVTIYVALGIFAAFGVVFMVVGLVGYGVQRRRRMRRRESQVEELKPITSGDTLLEQWLSWRIYETVE